MWDDWKMTVHTYESKNANLSAACKQILDMYGVCWSSLNHYYEQSPLQTNSTKALLSTIDLNVKQNATKSSSGNVLVFSFSFLDLSMPDGSLHLNILMASWRKSNPTDTAMELWSSLSCVHGLNITGSTNWLSFLFMVC